MGFLSKVTQLGGKAVLAVKKNVGTIEMGIGMGLVVWGTVIFIKSANDICEAETAVNEVKEDENSTHLDVAKTAIIEYGKATWKGIGLTGAGLILMGISHATMTKQVEALSASLFATSTSFNNYRKRVIEDQGEQKDYEYLTGGSATYVEQLPDGTTVTTTVPVNRPNSGVLYLPHSIMFDEANPNFEKSPTSNYVFLTQNLNWLNQELATKGYLTENHIRESIGAQLTVAGQAAGLFYENPDGTTNQLSFGLDANTDQARAFRDGEERSFLILLQKANGEPLDDNIYNRITDIGADSWVLC